MDLFLLSAIDCSDVYIQTVIKVVKGILTVIQWVIPLILIVLGTIDIFKGVSSNDDKATKEAQKRFGRRLIYAVVIFLIPWIIQFAFSLAANILDNADGENAKNTITGFFQCWNE